MARKDKKQIIGEPMTDEQIRAFLHGSREAGLDEDHHALLRAYRSLRSEDFGRFVAFFLADGRNVNAPDTTGRTVLSIISCHQQSADYAEVLKQVGGC
ncbi:PA4642 family protein [Alcanivorax sp. 1008]|uniref:PA4642 family protein n=1 Tax=Alcanivorax sp. 1008 TaxID=2816853 RepID=UPI001DC9543D|nr:PA4642 family protein [Alcanivorax sp. 1008]MCC1496434.1 PA4642 family protein [Alcanivorax sp. 1008]